MTFLALGAAILALLVAVGRGRLTLKSAGRLAVAALAATAAAGAFYEALRAQWVGSVILAALAAYVGQAARPPRSSAPPQPGGMSPSEARAILGVDEGATTDDIKAAYTRLMKRVHPDVGGAPGLAAQLNAARATLLGYRRTLTGELRG